jgi:hypothetical protein
VNKTDIAPHQLPGLRRRGGVEVVIDSPVGLPEKWYAQAIEHIRPGKRLHNYMENQ